MPHQWRPRWVPGTENGLPKEWEADNDKAAAKAMKAPGATHSTTSSQREGRNRASEYAEYECEDPSSWRGPRAGAASWRRPAHGWDQDERRSRKGNGRGRGWRESAGDSAWWSNESGHREEWNHEETAEHEEQDAEAWEAEPYISVSRGGDALNLELQGQGLTVESLKSTLSPWLRIRLWKRLEELHPNAEWHYINVDLSSNNLGPEGAAVLGEFLHGCRQHGVNVRVLKMYRNRLGDEGMKHLARFILAQPKPLNEIHLSHNGITAAGAATLIFALGKLHPHAAYPFQTKQLPDRFVPCWCRMERNNIREPWAFIEALEQSGDVRIIETGHDTKDFGPVRAPSWCDSAEISPQVALHFFDSQDGKSSSAGSVNTSRYAAPAKALEQAVLAIQAMLLEEDVTALPSETAPDVGSPALTASKIALSEGVEGQQIKRRTNTDTLVSTHASSGSASTSTVEDFDLSRQSPLPNPRQPPSHPPLRNTFIDFPAVRPLMESFFEARQVQSAPASVCGDYGDDEDGFDVEVRERAATSMAPLTPVFSSELAPKQLMQKVSLEACTAAPTPSPQEPPQHAQQPVQPQPQMLSTQAMYGYQNGAAYYDNSGYGNWDWSGMQGMANGSFGGCDSMLAYPYSGHGAIGSPMSLAADLPPVPNASGDTYARSVGLPSVGSAGHHVGQCKPCAFVGRLGGCRSGYDCGFCHSCGSTDQDKRNQKTETNVPVQPA